MLVLQLCSQREKLFNSSIKSNLSINQFQLKQCYEKELDGVKHLDSD